MNNKKIDFLDLFIEAMEEKAEESLKNGSIQNLEEINSLQQKTTQMFGELSAKIKILEGKKIKEEFIRNLESLEISELDLKDDLGGVSLAFRNKNEENAKVDKTELAQLILFSKIKNKFKNK